MINSGENYNNYLYEKMLDSDGPDDDCYGSNWDPADFKTSVVKYDNCVKKTAKAVRVSFTEHFVWLPLSRIRIVESHKLIRLPRWLIDKHNLHNHIIKIGFDVMPEIERYRECKL